MSVIALGTISSANPPFRDLDDTPPSIKGTVVDSKGTLVPNCPIKFMAPISFGGKSIGGKSPRALMFFNKVVATAVTDAKGAFEVKAKLAPDTYDYIAGNRALGFGGGTVTVEAGKTAVAEIKLEK